MNTATQAKPLQPTYLIDNRANLIIEQGETRMVLDADAALELIVFLDRTGHLARAKSLVKGASQ